MPPHPSPHIGWIGVGKMVVNTLVGATAPILGEAMLLGTRGGLTAAQMLEVLTQSAVASPRIGYKRGAIEAGDFSPAFTLQEMVKDFALISDAGRQAGVAMFVANPILQHFLRASGVWLADSSP